MCLHWWEKKFIHCLFLSISILFIQPVFVSVAFQLVSDDSDVCN